MGTPASHSTGDSSLHRGAAHPGLKLKWGVRVCLLLLCKEVCTDDCRAACSASTAHLDLEAYSARVRLS